MNKRQKQKIMMFRRVLDIIDANPGAWDAIPGFVDALDPYRGFVEGLEVHLEMQTQARKGVTASKYALRDQLSKDALLFADLLVSLALQENDLELVGKMSFTPSDLDRAAEVNLVIILKSIKVQIEAHATALEGMGITTEAIQSFVNHVALFDFSVMKSQQSLKAQKNATRNIQELIDEIDRHLEFHLDVLVRVAGKTTPEFEDLYVLAREMNKPSVRHREDDFGSAQSTESDEPTLPTHENPIDDGTDD